MLSFFTCLLKQQNVTIRVRDINVLHSSWSEIGDTGVDIPSGTALVDVKADTILNSETNVWIYTRRKIWISF